MGYMLSTSIRVDTLCCTAFKNNRSRLCILYFRILSIPVPVLYLTGNCTLPSVTILETTSLIFSSSVAFYFSNGTLCNFSFDVNAVVILDKVSFLTLEE